jgi:hypothetical protein
MKKFNSHDYDVLVSVYDECVKFSKKILKRANAILNDNNLSAQQKKESFAQLDKTMYSEKLKYETKLLNEYKLNCFLCYCQENNLKPNRGASVLSFKNRYLKKYSPEIQKRIKTIK